MRLLLLISLISETVFSGGRKLYISVLNHCFYFVLCTSSSFCRGEGSHPKYQTSSHKSNTHSSAEATIKTRGGGAAGQKVSTCSHFSPFLSHDLTECAPPVLQCRTPVQSTMEAVCTSVGWMVARLTATAALVTSWLKTEKCVKVFSPLIEIMT